MQSWGGKKKILVYAPLGWRLIIATYEKDLVIILWKWKFSVPEWSYDHWGFGERNKEENRGIASWLSVLSMPIAVILHKARWTLRYSATGKARRRLRRMIRDKEWIPYKGCLKRFEPFSLAETWLTTVWSRSKPTVLFLQSVLRPQSAAPRSALNDNDLHDFRIKQIK